MTDHEALLAAADFIGTDGSDLSDIAADEVAATLRRIAADRSKRCVHVVSGVSVSSFDGHCVRVDFETRAEADAFAEALPK